MRAGIFFVAAMAAVVSACAYAPSTPPSIVETRAVLDEVGGSKLPPPKDIVVLPRGAFADRFGAVKASYDDQQKTVYLPDDWRYGPGMATLAHELKHYVDDASGARSSECGASRAAADYAAGRGWNEAAWQQVNYGVASGCTRRQVDSAYDRIWLAQQNAQSVAPFAVTETVPELKRAAPASETRVAAVETAKPMPRTVTQPGFWVEYAAFKGPDHANRLVKRLESMGVSSHVVATTGAAGKPYYRVRSDISGDRGTVEVLSRKVAQALKIRPVLHRQSQIRVAVGSLPRAMGSLSAQKHDVGAVMVAASASSGGVAMIVPADVRSPLIAAEQHLVAASRLVAWRLVADGAA